MFHNPRERCPFNPCLLGHDEAREAFKASKAFGRVERLAKYQEETLRSAPAAKDDTNPNQAATLLQTAANQQVVQTDNNVQATIPKPQENPPVNFETLVKQNETVGQKDEFKRIYELTESLKNDLDAFKQQAAEKEKAKDNEVRSLQEAMGEMCNENAKLKEENESKLSVLDNYYKHVFEDSSNTRALIDLEKSPPSEIALEGALTILSTMAAVPVELADSNKIIDLFHLRPITRFSDQVSTLQDLGLTTENREHAFFLQCYMKYPVDSSFCEKNILDHASAVVSIAPGGAFPPKASVLKKTPKRFRRIFYAQTSSKKVSNVPNSSLSLKQGGGLSENKPLPREVHALVAAFAYNEFHKNPTVPLISQIVSYFQNGLTDLDKALLRYQSPVYNTCPLKLKVYKNGRQDVTKNKNHPAFEKWDALVSRVHFNTAYSTTRLTFPWKGFYLPGARISNHRDKYAFFAFAYATDLFLGALPLWPLDAAAQFQLDRKDPLRHYTLDNVRWLERSDNMANKPSFQKEAGTYVKSTKDVLRILKSCERNNQVCTEMLGALTKGYGEAMI